MKFKVLLIVEIDKEENILPVDEDSYNESVQE